jgi:hypothetical protein
VRHLIGTLTRATIQIVPSYGADRCFAREILRMGPGEPAGTLIGTLTRAKIEIVPSCDTERIFAREIVRMGTADS